MEIISYLWKWFIHPTTAAAAVLCSFARIQCIGKRILISNAKSASEAAVFLAVTIQQDLPSHLVKLKQRKKTTLQIKLNCTKLLIKIVMRIEVPFFWDFPF